MTRAETATVPTLDTSASSARNNPILPRPSQPPFGGAFSRICNNSRGAVSWLATKIPGRQGKRRGHPARAVVWNDWTFWPSIERPLPYVLTETSMKSTLEPPSVSVAGRPGGRRMLRDKDRLLRIRIDGGGYRRDHLRALAQRVEVADREVRIIGSKGKLLQTLTAAAGVKPATSGVRSSVLKWRRGWDSNPRYPCGHNGFRDRPDRPLWHLSAARKPGRNGMKGAENSPFLAPRQGASDPGSTC